MTTTVRNADKAVRRIKGLPKNRNVSAPRVIYRCVHCSGYNTVDLTHAWMHSQLHGPWPAYDGGTLTNLPDLPDSTTLCYNRGKQIIALAEPVRLGAPTVRRVR